MSSNAKKEECAVEEFVATLESDITSMSLTDKNKYVMLTSSDEEEFVVEESVAVQSEMIKNIIEDCSMRSVPLHNVNGKTLARVIEYCTKHSSIDESKEDLDKFDEQFLDVDQSILFDLIMAANYLAIKGLLNKICKKVAGMMKGKTVEEIREIFEIENDFDPDQEKEIRLENPWAFQ